MPLKNIQGGGRQSWTDFHNTGLVQILDQAEKEMEILMMTSFYGASSFGYAFGEFSGKKSLEQAGLEFQKS